MKKSIIFLLGFFIPILMKAQVMLNLQLPSIGLSVKSQLWNMTVSNTGTEPIDVKLTLVMIDVATGQQVLSGSTGIFNLSQGNHLMQYGDVLPVNYIVLNSNYAVDALPDGFLPPGNYNICYEVIRVEEVSYRLVEECADVTVETLSPPFLVTPDDVSEIDELRPTFTWLPPAPVYLINNLSYDFKLVELFSNQAISDAIIQNFPVVSAQNITTTNLLFPSSQPDLDTGKTYVWQIVANSNGQAVSGSEIWVFKVKSSGTGYVPLIYEEPYIKLKKEAAAGHFICKGLLKVEYHNEINDSTVRISVYDENVQERRNLFSEDNGISLRFGQNLISIDISSTSGFVTGHKYTVEIMNSKNEIWRGRFLFKSTN